MNREITITAPCTEACPAGIDVPRYIRHILNRDFDAALAVIREKIPFPAVCGYACVHPCEAGCARNQYDEPVAIRLLKRAAAEKGKGTPAHARKAVPSGKRVAVIGSGPCGLTAAYYLCGLGHAVTVFEVLSKAGGMLRYGIPGYRLPNDIVDREIAQIQACGVDIRTNATLGSARDLLDDGYDAVLVASGAWKSVKMEIEGEDAPMVVDGISFLQEVNSGVRPAIGQKVVVVGGGNTAIDAARASVRLGAETELIYRRSREDMPAAPEEVAEAEAEGVRIRFMAAPIRVGEGEIACIKMEPGPADGDGRPAPVPVQGSEFSLSCDMLITAVGQMTDAEALQLQTDKLNRIEVDAALATPVKGIFAAGDAVSGPKTIIDAIAQGRLASSLIDRYLGGKGEIEPEATSKPDPEPRQPRPLGECRERVESLPVKDRLKGFGLVESGFNEAAAVCEAQRCLACDVRSYHVEVNPLYCKDCGYCREMCGMEVFAVSDTFNASGYKPAVVKSPQRCVGCLKCVYICPDFAITLEDVSETAACA